MSTTLRSPAIPPRAEAAPAADPRWLLKLYSVRAAFSLAWVAVTFMAASRAPLVASVLVVLYPAWDALANLVDARHSGGLAANPPQAMNAVLSALATVALGVAVTRGIASVFVVFGAWAIVAGLLQLATALRRWKQYGAQWPMVLSGAQSALAGVFFVQQAGGTPDLHGLLGYPAVGAAYFLVSAAVLWFKRAR